jgi:glycogen operon protein
LNDLVSYNDKHNVANGENNRDGSNDNNSWNCGTEGETDDKSILEVRARQQRNFMATLLLSQGVPMIYSGDELMNSQGGNNNAYCQDNSISWLDWEFNEEKLEFFHFVCSIIQLRLKHPVLHRRRFFHGKEIRGSEFKDIYWLTPTGTLMQDKDWNAGFVRCLGVVLNGQIDELNEHGERIMDDNFLLLLNAHHEEIDFVLPSAATKEEKLELLLYTANPIMAPACLANKNSFRLLGRSMAVLSWPNVYQSSSRKALSFSASL